ncbi:hypothetical protein B0J11DRAFT_597868 [Dendryphion nanum]|uniref:Inositolphosphotransferase Aur1/Ipt1 domain-containing protein n=1 Tax=Dendryphion nanum TaxID=256645 RepID=A0A9P9D2Y0_9PLEO|nr:hypothetical protein B0J11DRAFT_597868 [Dendryphion nanum]
MGTNSIANTIEEPDWNSTQAWKLPGWAEPMIVVSILLSAMHITRRRDYSIRRVIIDRSGYSNTFRLHDSSDGLVAYDSRLYDDNYPNKQHDCYGELVVEVPKNTQFESNWQSRVLQKYPFLIEMFYWVANYLYYRFTSFASQILFAGSGIWNAVQANGIAVLEIEAYSFWSFLFPIRERRVQQWFMHSHQARRTMTLTNLCAFATFIFYPCMPPRLLPREYGFLDTVRHDDAQSVWMTGTFVNQLAAMPSMHFGYSFCIGITLIYHSGLFRKKIRPGERRKSAFWKTFYLVVGMAYPAFILTTIIATANHYFMDALVATCFVSFSFFCNKIFYIFIPLEDILLRALHAEKPAPTTGLRLQEHRSRV